MVIFLDSASPDGLYSVVDKGGVLGLLCLLIFVITVGGMRGWYYFGWYVKELLRRIEALETENAALRRDNDGWRQAAYSGIRTGERLAEAKIPTERP